MNPVPQTVSVLPEHGRTEWITAQRPPRAIVDPFKPHGFFAEQERSHSGRIANSAVILLTNKECPWRCLMCDLWQHTLTTTVPRGAIRAQIDYALERLEMKPEQIKLYNSGSFFDPAAIPPEDYRGISETVAFARHIVVESHPRLVGGQALRLRDFLSGSLEVAMGLETVHPEILPRLNKKFELRHFEQAAAFLLKAGIAMRAFVLVKPPFLTEPEGEEWAVKAAAFAFSCGAAVVSLIPTRAGNGAMERLQAAGEFTPPLLSTVERALERALGLNQGRAFADTWNLEQFSRCPACFPQRKERLHTMNRTQQIPAPVNCPVCTEP